LDAAREDAERKRERAGKRLPQYEPTKWAATAAAMDLALAGRTSKRRETLISDAALHSGIKQTKHSRDQLVQNCVCLTLPPLLAEATKEQVAARQTKVSEMVSCILLLIEDNVEPAKAVDAIAARSGVRACADIYRERHGTRRTKKPNPEGEDLEVESWEPDHQEPPRTRSNLMLLMEWLRTCPVRLSSQQATEWLTWMLGELGEPLSSDPTRVDALRSVQSDREMAHD
jgi:hypothetical protein